jgi:hypothetical protein
MIRDILDLAQVCHGALEIAVFHKMIAVAARAGAQAEGARGTVKSCAADRHRAAAGAAGEGVVREVTGRGSFRAYGI